MQHVRRMDILQTAQNLIDEGLEMGVGKWLARADDGCQVALHELCTVSASPCQMPRGESIPS